MNAKELLVKVQETDSARTAYKKPGWPAGVSCIPVYSTPLAAGCDLRSTVSVIIPPGCAVDIPVGVAVALPDGYEGAIRGRSGLWFNHRVQGFNGTIDADYRGEIKVSLINFGQKEYEVKLGERVGQMIVSKVERADFQLYAYLGETERGQGGFGSTDKKEEWFLSGKLGSKE